MRSVDVLPYLEAAKTKPEFKEYQAVLDTAIAARREAKLKNQGKTGTEAILFGL
jgi:hypothetical protein